MGQQAKCAGVRACLIGMAALMACGRPCVVWADAEPKPTREYKIKAAFLYHFITFVRGWDFEQKDGRADEADADDPAPILIGIIGRDPFQGAFAPLQDRQVQGRRVEVRVFKGLSELGQDDEEIERHPAHERIKQCDLVFISASERQYVDVLLEPIRQERILTVADTPGFLEKGGIINLLTEGQKVRFEINTAGARRAGLRIRSQLLRLARRLIDEDNHGEA